MKNIILIGLILLFVTAPVTAEIRLVPGEYATIQAAIDAAFEDDEIIVSIGTYYENINFGGKNIILRSTEPMNPTVVASTIIDGRLGDSIIGGYRAGSVVTFSGAESPECILSGFTITNGSGTGSMGDMRGGGIYGKGTHATIQHNIISGNHAFPYVYPGSGYGGGLYSCNGLIRNNIIWGNRTTCSEGSATGGGLYGCNVSFKTILSQIIRHPGFPEDGDVLKVAAFTVVMAPSRTTPSLAIHRTKEVDLVVVVVPLGTVLSGRIVLLKECNSTHLPHLLIVVFRIG